MYKSCGQVSCVLRAENDLPKVCGVFFKAAAQAVLLFESETWKLSPLSLKSPEGFHIQAAHRMAGKIPTWNPDGMWLYTSSRDVLKVVGLRIVDHYIGVSRDTFAHFIMDQPLFALCRDGERKRGSAGHKPLSIDIVEALPGDKEDEGDDLYFHWGQSDWLG